MTMLPPPLYQPDWELPSLKEVREEEEKLIEEKEEEEEEKWKVENMITREMNRIARERLSLVDRKKREKEDMEEEEKEKRKRKEEQEKKKKRRKEVQEKKKKEEEVEEEKNKKDISMSVPSKFRQRIYPILSTAMAIEKNNHRVAYLCAYNLLPFSFSLISACATSYMYMLLNYKLTASTLIVSAAPLL